MSYYPPQNRQKLSIGADGNALMNLIALQLIVFVVFAFVQVIYLFTYAKQGLVLYHKEVFPWIALPAQMGQLIERPWTIISHMLLHDGIWPVLANLLWLWAFGYIYQDFTGYRKIVPLFIYGALAGALGFVLANNLLPHLSGQVASAYTSGAGSGVMAIAVATTLLAPNFRIFPMLNGGIPLWVITLLYSIISFASIPYANNGEHVARIFAAAMGFLFQSQQNRGRDWGAWMNQLYDWFNNLFNPERPRKGQPPVKEQLFYKAAVAPYRKQPIFTQQRVDEILDKINQKGFKSLTEEEKEILRRASNNE